MNHTTYQSNYDFQAAAAATKCYCVTQRQTHATKKTGLSNTEAFHLHWPRSASLKWPMGRAGGKRSSDESSKPLFLAFSASADTPGSICAQIGRELNRHWLKSHFCPSCVKLEMIFLPFFWVDEPQINRLSILLKQRLNELRCSPLTGVIKLLKLEQAETSTALLRN